MNDTLHRTLRNRTSAKLLLCRQWVERINFHSAEMVQDILDAKAADDWEAGGRAVKEYDVWGDRFEQDLAQWRKRLLEDGYNPGDYMPFADANKLEGDVQFMPLFAIDVDAGCLVSSRQVHVWHKAVSDE